MRKNEIIVIYPQDKQLQFKAASDDVMDALHEAWVFLQRIDEPNEFLDENKARSSMVGDIYIFKTTHVFFNKQGVSTFRYFICDPCGFKEVTKTYSHAWERMERIYQCFGTDHAEKHGLIERCQVFDSPGIAEKKG